MNDAKNCHPHIVFVREWIVLTMTTAAMYSKSINSLDVWERVTLGLAEIWTTDPLPTIPHQVETQLIASQPFPVSVSGLTPSLSAAPVPCWFRKCQNQATVTQTVREYPHQQASQTQGLHDTPRSQLHFKQHHPMQWKIVLCCTLQFLHCDWFRLPPLSAGHCGVMDKWLDTHARRCGFKPSSWSYIF